LYVLHGDADEDDHGPSAEHGVAGNSSLRTEGLKLPVLAALAPSAKPAERTVWAHMLTQPVPDRIAHGDAAVDEVQLLGTFNMAVEREALTKLLAEARRVLRPNGTIFAHVLTSNGATVERPSLPGPAALVERVLPLADVVQLLGDAGFVGVQLTKIGEQPCYTVESTELRETKVTAVVPTTSCCAEQPLQVIYKGPLSQMVDDQGNTYRRGVPTVVSAAAWEALRAVNVAEQFVCFGGGTKAGGCCG
jgi:hypothetical protein